MAGEKSSVLYYTKARINLEVNFPEKSIFCTKCFLCRYNKELKTAWCDILGQYKSIMNLSDAERMVHPDCPLQFEEAES